MDPADAHRAQLTEPWLALAGRLAGEQLADEAEVLRSIDRAGLLEDPLALERAVAALETFWELVHDEPGRALGLVTVGWVAARRAGEAPAALLADLRHHQGVALFALGRSRDAAAALEGGLHFARVPAGAVEAGDFARRRAALLGWLATVRLGQGNVPRALVALEEGIALARGHGLRALLGVLVSRLGNARLFVGEARAAADYYEDALRISRSLGNKDGEAVNLHNLGLARQGLGDLDPALELFHEALALAHHLGDRRHAATIEANIAHVLAEQGDLEQAALHHEVALELARATSDRATQAVALVRLAGVSRERGALSEAQARLDEAERLLQQLDDPRRTAAWVEGAKVALEVPDADGARALLLRALGAAREVGDRRGEAHALRELGRAERVAGRLDRSLEHLTGAFELAKELEDPDLEALAASSLAESSALGRDVAAAHALLERTAGRASARAGSTVEAQHALARAAVARAAGDVPLARALLEELVAAARERGLVATQREASRRLASMS